MNDKEKALIDCIIDNWRWCPFNYWIEEHNGDDACFEPCDGWQRERCEKCIYDNTDKLRV